MPSTFLTDRSYLEIVITSYSIHYTKLYDVSSQSGNGASVLSRRLWFDRRTFLVVKEDRLTETGEVDATIQYEDFRAIGGVSDPSSMSDGRLLRPFKITLEDGRGRGSVQVLFHELIPNATLKPTELAQR